jgi:hypothetical protein
MNELFAQIKADLTDRRLLPIVAAVCALLVAAIAYALLGGGGGGSSTPLRPTPVPSGLPPGIAVTGATAAKAVAETTDGYKEQKQGTARNPFIPLAGPAPASAAANAATAPATSSSSAPSSSSSASTTSTETSSSSSSSEPSKSGGSGTGKPKSKVKTVYDVAVKFGELPPGTTPEQAKLTEYKKLKLQTALPSTKQPLVVFRGVTAHGASATFTLVGEAILTGTGACLPSPQQCQAVDLKPGEIEQLDYLAPNGQTTIYELRVLTIESHLAVASRAKASAARRQADSASWGVSKTGEKLLRKAGLFALPFLRYSSDPGVLVFAPPSKHEHHAHDAKRSARR